MKLPRSVTITIPKPVLTGVWIHRDQQKPYFLPFSKDQPCAADPAEVYGTKPVETETPSSES